MITFVYCGRTQYAPTKVLRNISEVLSFEANNCIVTSERYRDFSTDMLCKTFALRLDENRVLLVDVMADWL